MLASSRLGRDTPQALRFSGRPGLRTSGNVSSGEAVAATVLRVTCSVMRRRCNALVSNHGLDHPNVYAIFQQVRSKTVAQCVRIGMRRRRGRLDVGCVGIEMHIEASGCRCDREGEP